MYYIWEQSNLGFTPEQYSNQKPDWLTEIQPYTEYAHKRVFSKNIICNSKMLSVAYNKII